MDASCLLMEGDDQDWWPRAPKEELLDAKKRPLMVSFDLEATGLSPGARFIQLAAYCPKSSQETKSTHSKINNQECPECFNRFVLPKDVEAMEESAFAKTGMRIGLSEDGVRALIDDRTGCVFDSVSEETALVDFLQWLRQRAGGRRKWEGVLLVSHGAVLLDVPLVFDAVYRHGLQKEFFSVVVGWCDSLALFKTDPSSRRGRELRKGQVGSPWYNGGFALNALYTEIVKTSPGDHGCFRCGGGGDSGGDGAGDAHRADADARRLHQLLCSYFQVNELALATMPAIMPACFSVPCLKRLTLWRRRWFDVHWEPLWDFISAPSKSRTAAGTKKESVTEKHTHELTRESKPKNSLGVLPHTVRPHDEVKGDSHRDVNKVAGNSVVAKKSGQDLLREISQKDHEKVLFNDFQKNTSKNSRKSSVEALKKSPMEEACKSTSLSSIKMTEQDSEHKLQLHTLQQDFLQTQKQNTLRYEKDLFYDFQKNASKNSRKSPMEESSKSTSLSSIKVTEPNSEHKHQLHTLQQNFLQTQKQNTLRYELEGIGNDKTSQKAQEMSLFSDFKKRGSRKSKNASFEASGKIPMQVSSTSLPSISSIDHSSRHKLELNTSQHDPLQTHRQNTSAHNLKNYNEFLDNTIKKHEKALYNNSCERGSQNSKSKKASVEAFKNPQMQTSSKSPSISSIKTTVQNSNQKPLMKVSKQGFFETHRQQTRKNNNHFQFRGAAKPKMTGRPQKGHFIKLKIVAKNILAAGLCLSSMEKLWQDGGRDAVVAHIRKMKRDCEGYFTDTWDMSAVQVGEHVALALAWRLTLETDSNTTNGAENELASLTDALSSVSTG